MYNVCTYNYYTVCTDTAYTNIQSYTGIYKVILEYTRLYWKIRISICNRFMHTKLRIRRLLQKFTTQRINVTYVVY